MLAGKSRQERERKRVTFFSKKERFVLHLICNYKVFIPRITIREKQEKGNEEGINDQRRNELERRRRNYNKNLEREIRKRLLKSYHRPSVSDHRTDHLSFLSLSFFPHHLMIINERRKRREGKKNYYNFTFNHLFHVINTFLSLSLFLRLSFFIQHEIEPVV